MNIEIHKRRIKRFTMKLDRCIFRNCTFHIHIHTDGTPQRVEEILQSVDSELDAETADAGGHSAFPESTDDSSPGTAARRPKTGAQRAKKCRDKKRLERLQAERNVSCNVLRDDSVTQRNENVTRDRVCVLNNNKNNLNHLNTVAEEHTLTVTDSVTDVTPPSRNVTKRHAASRPPTAKSVKCVGSVTYRERPGAGQAYLALADGLPEILRTPEMEDAWQRFLEMSREHNPSVTADTHAVIMAQLETVARKDGIQYALECLEYTIQNDRWGQLWYAPRKPPELSQETQVLPATTLPAYSETVIAPDCLERFRAYCEAWNAVVGKPRIPPDIPHYAEMFAMTEHRCKDTTIFARAIEHLQKHPQSVVRTGKISLKATTIFSVDFVTNVLASAYDIDFSKQHGNNRKKSGVILDESKYQIPYGYASMEDYLARKKDDIFDD